MSVSRGTRSSTIMLNVSSVEQLKNEIVASIMEVAKKQFAKILPFLMSLSFLVLLKLPYTLLYSLP
jgi:hypothetical protein